MRIFVVDAVDEDSSIIFERVGGLSAHSAAALIKWDTKTAARGHPQPIRMVPQTKRRSWKYFPMSFPQVALRTILYVAVFATNCNLKWREYRYRLEAGLRL